MSDEVFIGTPCKYKLDTVFGVHKVIDATLLFTGSGKASLLYIKSSKDCGSFISLARLNTQDNVYYEIDYGFVLMSDKNSPKQIATALFNIDDPELRDE